MSDPDIARGTDIPKATVNRWRLHPYRRRRFEPPPIGWCPSDAVAYCYLLGLYLGDGHIVAVPNCSPALKLALDERATPG